MNTISLTSNGIYCDVPAELPDLAAQVQTLREIDETKFTDEELAEMWGEKADRYEAIGYYFNAEKCRGRANHYRGVMK
jgi:hypothetical protein